MGEDALLFKNKYRIPSARLKGWDYSSEGWYFITINIKNKVWLFGEVIDNEMRLNDYGRIVREEWENSFRIRRELICRTYIIMPDHIHGLVGIVEPYGNGNEYVSVFAPVSVETHGRASLRTNPTNQNPKMPQRMPRSISSFVAGFKSAATKRIMKCAVHLVNRYGRRGFMTGLSGMKKSFLLSKSISMRIRGDGGQNSKEYLNECIGVQR